MTWQDELDLLVDSHKGNDESKTYEPWQAKTVRNKIRFGLRIVWRIVSIEEIWVDVYVEMKVGIMWACGYVIGNTWLYLFNNHLELYYDTGTDNAASAAKDVGWSWIVSVGTGLVLFFLKAFPLFLGSLRKPENRMNRNRFEGVLVPKIQKIDPYIKNASLDYDSDCDPDVAFAALYSKENRYRTCMCCRRRYGVKAEKKKPLNGFWMDQGLSN